MDVFQYMIGEVWSNRLDHYVLERLQSVSDVWIQQLGRWLNTVKCLKNEIRDLPPILGYISEAIKMRTKA